jgi:hypothetical protein
MLDGSLSIDQACVFLESSAEKPSILSAVTTHTPDHARLFRTVPAPPDDTGCPYVVVVCSAALRAANIVRQLRPLGSKAAAKLFAKHFKLQEHVEMLQVFWPVVVGTPNRLLKLVEMGALSFTRTKLLVVDSTKNTKKFDILDIQGVKEDLVALLHTYVRTAREQLKLCIVNDPAAA